MDETLARVIFGRGGNADRCVGAGWSAGEDGFRWMIDEVSEFWLDCPIGDGCVLDLDLHPLVGLPLRPAQRVTVLVNETEVYNAALSRGTSCTLPILPVALSAEGRIRITIRHPDAISPRDLTGTNDQRRLALAIREARLYRPNGPAGEGEAKAPETVKAPAVKVKPARLVTVFVGNCQAGALSTLYRRLLGPDCDHDVTYIASYMDATTDAREAVANATTVVLQVLDFVPRIGELATKAKVYLVPHASASFLWPYAGSPHPLNRSEPVLEQSGPYNAELGDAFLNRMIAAGMPPESALSEYVAAEVATVRRAERMMDLHMQRQRDRDTECDFRVADRIERQLGTTRMFRSPNCPEPIMAIWIAGELFARMGEDPAAIARLVAEQPDALPATETPLHPAVVRHFGLSYAPPSRRYRFFDEGGFTFVEYAGRYMRYEWNSLLAEGMQMLRQKQAGPAVIKLEMALATAQRSAVGRMAQAEALAALGRLRDAVEYACQAVTIEPENKAFINRLWQLSDQLRIQPRTPV